MLAVGLVALASLGWTADGLAQTPVNAKAAAMADFNKRITAYLDVTKKATAGLPPLKRTDDPAEIALRETALGDAIRAERAAAKPGDIITPDVAGIFRHAVKDNFRHRPSPGRKVMLDEMPQFHPKVNQTYPSEWPLATFPATLLTVIPALPDGLEYRLLSDALIIRDVKANIVVDFILDVY